MGYIVSDCSCANANCLGSSILGRECTLIAQSEFVGRAHCLSESFVCSHRIVTQDTASVSCGSETLLGCTCSAKNLSTRGTDCEVFEDGNQCRLRPLSTGETAFRRLCLSGSCSDGWLHLQVFEGFMIQLQRSDEFPLLPGETVSEISIPKGSYNVETLRRMLPENFEWRKYNIVEFTESDNRKLQAICADVRPNFVNIDF